MCFEVVGDVFFHVDAVGEAAGHVAFIGEEEEVVWFAVSDEGVDEAGGVAEMDVFVDETVDEEEFTFDFVDMVENTTAAVAVIVGLGKTHVSFGVMGVVAVPIGDGGASNGDFKGVGGAGKAHERHVATVAPAVDADTGGVG